MVLLMKRWYVAKAAPVFTGFYVFGNKPVTFMISCQLSMLFERMLQPLNRFLFNRLFLIVLSVISMGIQKLEQHVGLVFSFLKNLKLFIQTTGTSLPFTSQYPKQLFIAASKNLLKFSKDSHKEVHGEFCFC